MSELDDYFDDDWDDFTPSFQDKLLENLECVENNNLMHDDNNLDKGLSMDFTSSKAAFNVFLDELFEIPFKIKSKTTQKKPLGEVSINQQHNNISHKEKHHLDKPKEMKIERFKESNIEKIKENRVQKTKEISVEKPKEIDTEKPKETTIEKLIENEAENMYDQDSQEDIFWTDFDSDLFSKLESNIYNTSVKATTPMPAFTGFSTASGKAIKPPSKEAIQKALKLQIEDPIIEKPTIDPFTCGFTTATGKKLNISDEAKKKALDILNANDDENDVKEFANPIEPKKETKMPVMAGFTTASGKPVKTVSEKARLRAEMLFKELEENEKNGSVDQPLGPKLSNQNSTANIKSVEPLRKPIKRPSDEPLAVESKISKTSDLYGRFKTGSSVRGVDMSLGSKIASASLLTSSYTSPLLKNKENTPNQRPALKAISSSNIPSKPLGSNTISNKENAPSNIPQLPKRNKRLSSIQQNKPFKSPIVRSNIELTKAAIHNKNALKPKNNPVFDLTIPQNRYTLASLGKPLQFTKEQLVAKNIPISIINMTIHSAKDYEFHGNWGFKSAKEDMIKAGAISGRIVAGWIENHYRLIIWKFACLIRSYPSEYANYWNKKKVLDQLLYRYEREVNMGHRPVLKKVMEQDDISVKHMVLVITDIVQIKAPLFYNTSSKYHLVLSDGWYQVPACIDTRMERAIELKKLRVGHKLSICGSQIVGDKTAQSPLTITNNSTILSISTNGCLPVPWDTKLGYQKRKLIMRSITSVFDDGGAITALDIVVCRKFPILYSETLPNGTIVTRTAKEEEEARHSSSVYDNSGRRTFALPNFKADIKSSSVSHQERASESKRFEERRVTGFFKIRICDANSNSDQQLATLLISNANELNHMDIIEGNRYRVFFTMPYRPKSKKYPGLDLKTTRMTRWEPAPLNNLKNAYVPRSITSCQDIYRQNGLLDFDLVVYVIQAGTATLENTNGRKLWHQKLFLSDESGKICQIDFRLPGNPFSDIKGQVIGLVNARFELYDNKFDITCLKTTDETEILSKSSNTPEYIQKGISNLRKWISANPESIQMLNEKLQHIVQ